MSIQPGFSSSLKRVGRAALKDKAGVAGILFALVAPTLMSAMALGLETGLYFLERRKLQTAADVAAISAGYEILGRSGSEDEAAEQEANRHGVTADRGDTITVHYPPRSGSAANSLDAVEVILERSMRPLFSGAFRAEPITVSARAVARTGAEGDACILALDRNGYRAVDVAGTARISMPTCIMAANSTNAEALSIRGRAEVRALTVTAAGGYAVAGSANLITQTPPRGGVPPLPDPYADRAPPAPAPCDHTGFSHNGSRSITISPGVYCDGLNVGAQSSVDLRPGTYVIRGGTFNVNGGASVTCSLCTGTAGVTIVLTGSGRDYASVTINGGARVSLKAPATGPYAGLLFFQDRNAPPGTTNRFNGGASMQLTGALYFPNQSVEFEGNAAVGPGGCTHVVARTVSFTGAANLGNDCDDVGVEQMNVLRTVDLIE